MNLDEALSSISGVLAEVGRTGPVVGPGRRHVLFQYARARGKVDHDENVMRGYWSLMMRRAAWLAM